MMRKLNTVDGKYLEIDGNGPYIRVFLKGPKGGYNGAFLLNQENIEEIIIIFKKQLRVQEG